MVTAAVPSSTRLSGPRASEANHDDLSLISSIARGEHAALDHLYRRYCSAAFAVAYVLVRDPSTAEDIVQDAFFRAWRGAASFVVGRGSVRSWLLAIVRNAALDHLRAEHVAQRHQTGLVAHEGSALAADDVSTTVSLADDARRLRAALQALPRPQRDAIELAFLEGLSHGEIAARTGTPLGTVKGRVRLGLRQLRHDLCDLGATGYAAPLSQPF